LFAGLFELVPMVGATLGAIPAVLVALFQGPTQLVLVIAFVFVLQQIENNLLVPAVMGSQLEISPLLTIIALLIGGALMGIIGALLAVPVAAVLQVVWLDVVVPWIKGRQLEAD
jgi:predicted PurR-regulated permease PerM